ncbi:MAG TPA: hypothetical protein VGI87_15860 [Solirubrobacteraceae bacterium]|jgi:hypothetical protein
MFPGGYLTADAIAANYDRVAQATIEPSLYARTAARLRAGALDRALIAGADPSRSPQLAARACALTSRRTRAAIAGAIERVMRAASEPGRRSRVTPRRAAVTSAAGELDELAGLLRSRSPLYARGIAMLRELLCDGAGPVYAGAPEDLASTLAEARLALAG